MNSQTVGLRVAGMVFGLVCIAQLARLLTGVEVVVAGREFPLWPNAVAAVVAGVLSCWMFWLVARGGE